MKSLPKTLKPKYSYHKISMWQQCHYKWKLYYIDRLVPKAPKAFPLQVGDVVDKLLNLYYDGKLKAETISKLDAFVKKLYPADTDQATLDVALEAGRLFQGYCIRYEDDPLKFVSTQVIVEKELPKYILHGRFDGLARPKDGGLWRVETKTTARFDSFYLGGLKGGLQGAIYDYLIEEVMKESVKGTIYNLLVKTKVPDYHRAYVAINRRAIQRMLQTVEGIHDEIIRGSFFPSSSCFTYNRECDYKLLCDHNTLAVREQFYSVRQTTKEEEKNGKINAEKSDS